MIELRKSDQRGHADHGWLNTYYSFSFADYYDRENIQFGPLRVLNEDFIKGGSGFPQHPHQDMEIVTYVLDGALAHRDSTGGEDVVKAGEVQRMTAGHGIEHSEFNASDEKDIHLLQVWFFPEKKGLKPGYEQRQLDIDAKNKLVAAVAPNGNGKTLKIHQDVIFYLSNLDANKTVKTEVKEGRLGYLHNTMIGSLIVNGLVLSPGDALKIRGPEKLDIKAKGKARFVLFDMGDK